MAETTITKRQLNARVRYWTKRLGLADWKFVIQVGPEEDGAEAACLAQPEYRNATLHFDLAKIPPGELDRYVVHEVTHCFVWALANCAHSLARGDRAMEEWVRTEEEALTTRLEDLLLQLRD